MIYRYLCIGWLCVFFILAGNPGFSALPRDTSVNKTESELKDIQKRIREAQQKKEQAQKQEVSVLHQLEGINQQIRVQGKQLNTIKGQLTKNVQEIQTLQKNLITTQSKLNIHQLYLSMRMRSLYLTNRVSPFRQLMSATDYTDQIRSFQYQRILAYADARALASVKNEASELRQQKFRIGEMVRYQKIQETEVSHSKEQFEGQQKLKGQLLTKIQTDKVFYEKTVKELQVAARRLEALLAELRTRQAEFPEGFASGDFAQSKGHLSWPVSSGKVIYQPGHHKILDDQVDVFSHGIGIQDPVGASVFAVHEGLVRYAGWLEGSGNTIIIDHGQQYMTLYMHLNSIFVSKGKMVKHKQIIGSVGDTGSLEGSQLEFQIRKSTTALNPMDWLANR